MQLELSDINLYFGKEHFLGPMNNSFFSGCLNIIVGRSGSGKSTLLKLLAGFHPDYSGKILIDGNKFNPEGNISLAFQNPEALFFNSSVFEEISFSLKVSTNLKSNEITTNTYDWMQKWGLDPSKYSDKYPFRLSGGEKRRVALAACTILQPNIILLDEPLAGLDRQGQSDLSNVINSLTDNHIVIVVTHEPELLIQDNSKIFLLDNSNITEYNSNEFLTNSIKNKDFYPLPNWYCNSLSSFVNNENLPIVNPERVAEFLKKYK